MNIMDKNKINKNFINQIKNKELYEENLFTFIVQNIDLKTLLNDTYHLFYSKESISVESNLEGFLAYNLLEDIEEHQKIKNKIYSHIGDNLLSPFYYVSMKDKKYVLKSSGMGILREYNFDNFFTKISNGILPKFNEDEEKFFIDFIMNYEFKMYSPSESTKKQISDILLNQKQYLNQKNDKSSINIFYENKNLKTILSLYSSEIVSEITDNTMNEQELVKLYFGKNFRKKIFDLSAQLENKDPLKIIDALGKQTKSKHLMKWIEPLISKGVQLDLIDLELFYCGKKKPISYHTHFPQKKVNMAAVSEMVSLVGLVKDNVEIKEEELSKIFIIVMLAGREAPYIKLRSMFEIPTNSEMQLFFANLGAKALGNRSIREVEAEILKNKIESDLEQKTTQTKKLKI